MTVQLLMRANKLMLAAYVYLAMIDREDSRNLKIAIRGWLDQVSDSVSENQPLNEKPEEEHSSSLTVDAEQLANIGVEYREDDGGAIPYWRNTRAIEAERVAREQLTIYPKAIDDLCKRAESAEEALERVRVLVGTYHAAGMSIVPSAIENAIANSRDGWCDKCEHYGLGCELSCCNEPVIRP